MGAMPTEAMEPRSRVLMTYALCGFANFGSIAIQIGGIGALAPERRGELARLGAAVESDEPERARGAAELLMSYPEGGARLDAVL